MKDEEKEVSFQDLSLSPELLRAVSEKGFEKPTEIQKRVLSFVSEGSEVKDFIAQAQTGTGKTAAFGLSLLDRIDVSDKNVQSLILAPTRELADQIKNELLSFSKYTSVKIVSVYGGVSITNQIRSLKRDLPQVVVGTPGRVIDLVNRKVLKLRDTKLIVLDEADEMLNMGFFEDVEMIMNFLSKERKTWLFSATVPRPILSFVNEFLDSPEFIKIKNKTLSNENIEQSFYVVKREDMVDALCRYLNSLTDFHLIIFCQTKIETKKLADELNLLNHTSDCLNGDMDQRQRDLTMGKFKKKKTRILVCTDVAARGIDVNNLTHVINFGFPQENESYVHRIGRTGRAGSKGKAVSIVSSGDLRRVRGIEFLTKVKLERKKLPTTDEMSKSLVKRAFSECEEKLKSIVLNKKDSFDDFSSEFSSYTKEDLITLLYDNLIFEKLKRLGVKDSIDFTHSARGRSSGSGFSSGSGSRGRSSRGRSQDRSRSQKRGRSSQGGRKRYSR